MKKPTISVIMSVYNDQGYLGESVESILNQTFKDFEFIIIDDGSKDKSVKIIKDYIKKDKRIFLIENKKNIGLTKSLNEGLKKARGKYIARMDVGDVSFPNRLKKQFKFLEENRDVFLNFTGVNFVDEDKSVIAQNMPLRNIDEIIKRLKQKNCIAHPSIMFRNEGQLYREKFRYAQDYDFYLYSISMSKKIAPLMEVLVDCRYRNNSLSSSKMAHQKLFAEKAKALYFERERKGRDGYGQFNPNSILKINTENSYKKIILESNMKANFGLSNYSRFRIFYYRYAKRYGIINKFLILYFASFLGSKLVMLIGKITPSGILRRINN